MMYKDFFFAENYSSNTVSSVSYTHLDVYKIQGKLTTFDVTTKSVHAGEVYAKTSTGYVGKFTDDTFGTYEACLLYTSRCV